MSKRDLLKFPNDFEGNMRALLATPPAPAGTAGSRKVAPKAPPKPKAPKRYKLKPKKGTALAKPGVSRGPKHAYEMAPVLKEGKRQKRKAKEALTQHNQRVTIDAYWVCERPNYLEILLQESARRACWGRQPGRTHGHPLTEGRASRAPHGSSIPRVRGSRSPSGPHITTRLDVTTTNATADRTIAHATRKRLTAPPP